MNPWQNIWAPNVHFPLSGSVAQQIEPTTNWFFDAIDANAGSARIERKAFEKASYGRQLGWLTEVVLALAEHSDHVEKGDDTSAFNRLKKIKAEIDAIKQQEAASTAEELESRLRWLKQHKKEEEFAVIADKLRAILNAPQG